jgi:hypothetical protein
MVAVLALVVMFLSAYIGSTWAAHAAKDERIAQPEAVLKRRGGAWHEVPAKPAEPEPLYKLWGRDDEITQTMRCEVPPSRDKTDPCAMVFE